MSVILTSMLQWTKFGDVGGDEAPCCGAAPGVNEMHADTEQLRMRQARDRAEEKSGRGARKVERLRPKRRYSCAITHRSARSQSPGGGDLLPAPRPTPDFLQKQAVVPLSPLSAITPCNNGEAGGETDRALTLTRSSFSEGPGLKL